MTLSQTKSRPTRRSPRWRRTPFIAVAVWLIATLGTAWLQPSLTTRGTFADGYAFVSLQLQVVRTPIAAVVLIASAVLAFRRRSRRNPIGLAIVACIGLLPEIRHAWPARGDDPAGKVPLRVMSLNNERLTTNTAAILSVIDAERPDLIAFQQFAAATDAAFVAAVGDRYPHRLTFASPPHQGVALYSRWPAELRRAPDFSSDDHGRILEACVYVAERRVRVFVVHLTSPRSVARLARNRQEVATLLDRLAADEGPRLVVGDFNAPFASRSVDAMRERELAHADDRAGWGPRWTWMPAHVWRIARIDHAFVSGHFAVKDSRVLRSVGSDHLPIVVDLAIRPGPSR
jgi:endonuclease/exonuclease/phosphatase (EEP) superfamily protein YafD